MKSELIPDYIDDDFVTIVIEECIKFIHGQAPCWTKRSCLNCPEARLLMQTLLASYTAWQHRQAQPQQHKRSLPQQHNRFELRPLIYDLSHTVNQLANADKAYLSPELKQSLKQSCTLILRFLKEWHNIEIGKFNELQLAQVS